MKSCNLRGESATAGGGPGGGGCIKGNAPCARLRELWHRDAFEGFPRTGVCLVFLSRAPTARENYQRRPKKRGEPPSGFSRNFPASLKHNLGLPRETTLYGFDRWTFETFKRKYQNRTEGGEYVRGSRFVNDHFHRDESAQRTGSGEKLFHLSGNYRGSREKRRFRRTGRKIVIFIR